MSKKNSVKSSVQDFSKVVHANISRSIFNRNSTLVTTFNAGYLVPIYLDEVLPGDTFEMTVDHVARLITPIQPVMDNLEIEIFAFYVPNRIIWDGWEQLQGENKTGAWAPASPPAGVPHYDSGTYGAISSKTVGDYYGLPPGLLPGQHSFSALPFRGYAKIWNDWFRNQNVQAPYVIWKGDVTLGNDSYSSNYGPNAPLLKVNKPFDYFTACLPSPQKGESQLIPIALNELIPVITDATKHITSGSNDALKWSYASSGTELAGSNNIQISNGNTVADTFASSGSPLNIVPNNLYADPRDLDLNLSTISDLRTAFQIQKLYERDARGGTRYIEMLKAHFGVDAGDYRLQRSEFLGHSKAYMNIHQVAQTSETTVNSPQGNLSAYGHSEGRKKLFTKSFVEHGFVHIFAVARQRKTYQQGLERFWTRQDRLDYFIPVLAHISEQPVYKSEIYALADNEGEIFGYNEAWSDYRFKTSKVTGQMRSNVTDSFDIWHYADIYSSTPTLESSWMLDNSQTNIERTLAVQDVDQILFNAYFRNKATRPMPTNSIPGYIDHF